MLLVDHRLVVVSQEPGYPYAYYSGVAKLPTVRTGAPQPSGIATISPIGFSGTTSLFVFDISNHASPVLTTRVEVNGTIAGARLIGNYVYLVATQPVFCYGDILLPEQILTGHDVKSTPVHVYLPDIINKRHSLTTIIEINVSLTITHIIHTVC